MKASAEEVAYAKSRLLDVLSPGDTVYCILRHVSRSGMSRTISLYAKTDSGMQWLDGFAVKLNVGSGFDKKRGGLKVGGCGMDMGFALVYELNYRLFPDGFGCTGERCPSNDHSNGDRDYTPHKADRRKGMKNAEKPARREHWHREGGYALTHKWL